MPHGDDDPMSDREGDGSGDAPGEWGDGPYGVRFQAQLLAASGQAMLATDPEGRIVYWNPAAERLYGWRADEVLGRDAAEVTSVEESAERIVEITRSLRAGRSWTGVVPSRDRDGRTFQAQVTDTPVFDDAGGIMAIICAAHDITAERAAAEVAGRLAAIVQSSPDGIISVSPEGIVESMNPAAEVLTGWTAAEVVGQPVSMLHPSEDESAEMADFMARVRRGEWIDRAETRRRRPNGEVYDMQLSLSPIRDADGTFLGMSAMARDITAQVRHRRVVEATEIRLAAMEREAQRLEVERAAAARANQAKSEFLSRMSHELRTPLNAVLGFGQLLQMERLDGSDAEAVDHIVRAGRHLLELIDEVLDIADLDDPDRSDVASRILEQERLDRIVARAEVPRTAGGPSPVPPGELVVVYIEDNAANLKLVDRALGLRGGVHLLVAEDGETGLALVREVRPSLVLLDLHLPRLDGREVLAALRADDDTAGIEVVIVSADATPDQVAQLLASGADGYLTKPFELEALYDLIDRCAPRR